jgi:hypothetical protein
VGSFKLAQESRAVGAALRNVSQTALPQARGPKVGVGGTAPQANKSPAKLPPAKFAGEDEEWEEF